MKKFLVITLLLPFVSYGQFKEGKFGFNLEGTSDGAYLTLRNDFTYVWKVNGIAPYRSEGTWKKAGRKILLIDSYTNGFDLRLILTADQSAETVRFNPAFYKNGETELDAFLFIDSSRSGCLLARRDCEFPKGAGAGIVLRIGDGVRSKKYKIDPQFTGSVSIEIQATGLKDYKVFSNAGLKLEGNGSARFFEDSLTRGFAGGVLLHKLN